jgi:hypothetical protein
MRGEMTNKVSGEILKTLLSVVIGGILWIAFESGAKAQDPDAQLVYWEVGYPISVLISGILGSFFPVRPWRWGVGIIWAQFVLGLVTTTGDLNLLPPGILLYMIITIPCIISGYVGAWITSLRRRKHDK